MEFPPELPPADVPTRTCTRCKKAKPLTDYTATGAGILKKTCEQCLIRDRATDKLARDAVKAREASKRTVVVQMHPCVRHEQDCAYTITNGRMYKSCDEIRTARYCTHGKTKYTCADCGGSAVCAHGKRRRTCIACEGTNVCKHKVQREGCKQCNDPVKVTISNMLKSAKTNDKMYNRYNAAEFVDKLFLKSIIEDSDGYCQVCGQDIQFVVYGDTLATLERIDNHIGHIKSNCLVACLACNRAHRD